MSAEKVGELVAELGIEDLSERQLAAAVQNMERAARRMDQIDDPRLEVDTDTVGSDLDRMEKRLRSVSDDDYTVTPEIDVSHVDDGAEDGKRRLGSMVSDWGTTLVLAAGVIGAAAGSKLADEFMDWAGKDAETDRLAASLGLNDWASARYGKLAGEIYAGAWGESFEEVTGALQIGANNKLFDFESTDAEISTVTERLIDLTKIFGQDLPAMADAAGQLIRNGMANDVWEAMDILTAGFQRGLDRNGDFLDSFSEYPALFQALGIEGPAALGMIDQILGSGARNTDLAADAIKEFTIRSKDGSTATSDAMKDLGLDAEDMAARFAEGGDTAAGAFDDVLDRIRDIDDPLKRSRVQVQLFGTQAEDLQTALDALDPSNATAAIGDVAGKAEEASERVNDNVATSIESLQRRTKQAVEDYMGDLWTAYDEEGVTGLTDKLQEDVDKLSVWWDENGDELLDGFKKWWSEDGQPLVTDVGFGLAGALWDGFLAGASTTLGDFVDDVAYLWREEMKPDLLAGLGIAADEVEDMFMAIPNAFIDALNGVILAWNSFELTLPSFDGLEVAGQTVIPGWDGPTVGTPDVDALPHFAMGGPVLAPKGSPVLAVIHGGEHVQTADQKDSQDRYIAQLERMVDRTVSRISTMPGNTTRIYTFNPQRYEHERFWVPSA